MGGTNTGMLNKRYLPRQQHITANCDNIMLEKVQLQLYMKLLLITKNIIISSKNPMNVLSQLILFYFIFLPLLFWYITYCCFLVVPLAPAAKVAHSVRFYWSVSFISLGSVEGKNNIFLCFYYSALKTEVCDWDVTEWQDLDLCLQGSLQQRNTAAQQVQSGQIPNEDSTWPTTEHQHG